MHWFIDPIKNHYADFGGRIGRQEYWMFILFSVLLSIALEIVVAVLESFIFILISALFSLGLLVPSIAMATRRLHDIGKSGWWQLLYLIPIIGWIIVIVWLASKTEPIANAYGAPAVPKMGPESGITTDRGPVGASPVPVPPPDVVDDVPTPTPQQRM